jgi:hypothetical protein
MSKSKKEEKKVWFCPLLKEQCIQEDCRWFVFKLDTCAVQVIPYNLYNHSNKLEECSRNYNDLLDYLTRPVRVRR